MPGPTPKPPEREPRKDDRPPPGTKSGEGVSATEPAEGADRVNPRRPGSPRA